MVVALQKRYLKHVLVGGRGGKFSPRALVREIPLGPSSQPWIDFQWQASSKWLSGSHIGFFVCRLCRWHGFWSITQVCFGISVSNFVCMWVVAVGRYILFFTNVTFKMAAWWSYGIFSRDQAALRTLLSIWRQSITHFSQCSCHRIILKFSGVITIDKRDVHANDQRSKVKVTEVKTQFNSFRTVTSFIKFQGHMGHKVTNFDPNGALLDSLTTVWIHWRLWNDAQSLK